MRAAEPQWEFAPRLVEVLRTAFGDRLVSVVLFGSHARGEHFLTDYGDEATYRDPWSLFGEADARRALEAARRCVSGAGRIFEEFPR